MFSKLILTALLITALNVTSHAQISPEDRAVLRSDILNRNIDLTRTQKNEIKKIFLSFERQYDKEIALYNGNPEGLEIAISLGENSMHKKILKVLDSMQGEMYVTLVSNNYEINPKKVNDFRNVKLYTADDK